MKKTKVRAYLSGCDAWVDIWVQQPRTLVVNKDIKTVDDYAGYKEQIVNLFLASSEPTVNAGERQNLRQSIYAMIVKHNPWVVPDSVRIVHEEKKRTENVSTELGGIVGQPHVVSAVQEMMDRSEAGIGDPCRPMSTMLFLGPTGVGKTYTAKKMSDALCLPLVRIDCAEYGEAHEYAKLIGAPPGYIGHDSGGRFDAAFDAIDKGAIILLDEVEKAHERVYNLILHVLDEGKFCTGQNKTIDFSKCYIVMTSNLGADRVEALKNRVGFSSRTTSKSEEEESYKKAIKAHFKPEFINRLDEILIFRSLDDSDADVISSGLLRDIFRRVRSKYKCKVTCSPAVKKRIIELGFSKDYGAREIKRTIRREVELCLAKALRSANIEDGTSLSLGVKDGVVRCELFREA